MRILLVEDHKDTLDVMSRVLEKHGHQVTPASTAHDAERLCGISTFDVMICDIMLPDKDGWDLAAVARQCGMPAIALSAMARPADVTASLKAGFLAHLVKPVLFDELDKVLATLPSIPKVGLTDVPPCESTG